MIPAFFSSARMILLECHESPAPHARLLILPTSSTRIKGVIAWWIALLILEDDEYALSFAKVMNPKIIKAMAKSSCFTHPPN
jgi:hypothetical protein